MTLATPPRRRPRRTLVGVWLGAAALALGAGVWVGAAQEDRRRREGERLADLAARLAAEAREAHQARDGGAALERLEAALRALEEVGVEGPVGASLRVDLASLLAREPAGEHLERARRLLDEAWRARGLSEALRARIARDRGAAELLAGDLAAARLWYGRADELQPGTPAGPPGALGTPTPAEAPRGR